MTYTTYVFYKKAVLKKCSNILISIPASTVYRKILILFYEIEYNVVRYTKQPVAEARTQNENQQIGIN